MDELGQFTVLLHSKIEKMRAGDSEAREELLLRVGERLERLARRMLRENPRVRRWAETGDVLQNALMRLLRALESVKPPSTRDFFSLAASQIRRELIDLARHYYGERGHGANLREPLVEEALPGRGEADDQDLEAWASFHEAVGTLEADQREVVSLVFYHGWTQQQVAELFQVDVRTIRRWWQEALTQLRRRCQEVPPL